MVLVLSGVIAIVLGLFSAWHISLVLRNYTTIEHMEETRFKGNQQAYLAAQSPKDKFNIFDLGYGQNWRQVMGNKPMTWFLPIPSSSAGDGYTFEISNRARDRMREQESLHDWERDEQTRQRFERFQHENLHADDFRSSDELDDNDRLMTYSTTRAYA